MHEENNKDDGAPPDAISEEQQLAKYDFYLEMMEKVKQVEDDEDYFMAAFRAIAAVRGILFHDLVQFGQQVTLQQLIFKFNSQLRDLEKRRKPQEELRKSLDTMVELIEDTDSAIKQYTRDNIPPSYLEKGASIIHNLTTPPTGYYNRYSDSKLLEIYAALHGMVNYKAPQRMVEREAKQED